IDVENAELNPYYGAFIIKNVKVNQSPLWLRNYLIAAGVRPINNVVDITNYVLLEYGQPLHAFDYDKLDTNQIVVRQAKENETMITLDGEERTLANKDLVITNGKEPIALAGVMAGANTEVSEESTRYEKGVDPNRVKRAGLRACRLLEKIADGEVLTGCVEFDELDHSSRTVNINQKEINKRLGTDISNEEISEILRKLRFDFKQDNEDYELIIPTRRGDISIFEDMLEEIARIYGYDHLAYTLPQGAS